MELNNENLTNRPLPPKPWSRLFDRCQRCGNTSQYHKGKGLCHNCYYIVYRENHPEIVQNARRKWTSNAREKNAQRYNLQRYDQQRPYAETQGD